MLTGKFPYFLEADDMITMTADTENAIEIVQGILDATDSLSAGPKGVGAGLTPDSVRHRKSYYVQHK